MFSFMSMKKAVTTADLAKKLTTGITLLDVRTPAEFRAGHIKQAKNKPLSSIDTYTGNRKVVYLICQSGARSAQAYRILQQEGYQPINVRGGMNQWRGAVVRG